MFLRVLCVITSALTVLTTLSMTSCGADNAISSEASESAVTSTADSGKTAKDILSAIEEYFTPLTAIMLTRYQCSKWLTEAVQKASLQTG